MKTTIVVVIAIVIIGFIAFFAFNNNPTGETIGDELMSTTTTEQGADTSTTTPGATEGSNAKSYTMAEVATHNSVSSCWAVVNGVVYDLTSWISKHPGGQQAILSLCGKDGTEAFTNQHGGQERPENTLAGFEIGILAQ